MRTMMIVLLALVFGSAAAVQCVYPGECAGFESLNSSTEGYFIMTFGGVNFYDYLDSVELTSPDPEQFPVPDCLDSLNLLPAPTSSMVGGLDYSGKSVLEAIQKGIGET